MICVMTRFRLNHVWDLASMYRALRSMRADLATAPGLIRHAFLVEGPRTCYTLSLWESEAQQQRTSFAHHHRDDLPALRAERHPHADLPPAFGDHERDHRVKANHRQQCA